MVTHDLDTIRDLATRVAVLADKKVLVEGTIEAVMQTDHPFIDAFFHGERGARAMGEAEKPLKRAQETSPQPHGK
jgi:phospholipid/cholesterol/gamma-HCH transport system ATP-binding protein